MPLRRFRHPRRPSHGSQGATTPPTSWLGVVRFEFAVLWRAAKDLDKHAGFTHAAALAFWGLLATIPFLLFVSGLFGFLVSSLAGADDTALRTQLADGLRQFFPRLDVEVSEYLRRVVEKRGALSLAALPLFLVMSASLLGTMQTAIGGVFHPDRKRNVARATLVSLVLLTSLFFGVVAAVLAGSALGALGGDTFRWLDAVLESAWTTWTLGLGVGTTLFAVLVRTLALERIAWRPLFAGGVLFSALWVAARFIFGFYVDKLAAYDLLYGSLTAFVVLLVWLYYTALVFLYAAEWVAVRRERSAATETR